MKNCWKLRWSAGMTGDGGWIRVCLDVPQGQRTDGFGSDRRMFGRFFGAILGFTAVILSI
ncbi:MAG: hypothetical protein ACLSA6_07390 [Holdemania massiliensis]